MKKLRSVSGESLMETILSILIITLAFAAITTATVMAAKINSSVRDRDNSFVYTDTAPTDITVTLEGFSTEPPTIDAHSYISNEYRYYLPASEE